MKKIQIATDFSRHPAGRNVTDGPKSGEHFRQQFLEPLFKNGEHQIVLELDGTRGYGSSFLEEAFGGLVRCGLSKDQILSTIMFVTTKPSLIQEIKEYIQKATNEALG